jgi:two-component system, NtrC family, sensor kinase
MKEFSHPSGIEKQPANIHDIIESSAMVAKNEWKYVAEVAFDFERALPPVPVLRNQLSQVLLNLIVNAAHAIEDVVKQRGGRGVIAIRTRREGPDTVAIAISDTGGGIPEAIRDRVFDPFFTTKDVGHGTGQGLALARTAIVDRHGGTISFETQLGEGTTFFVRLPIRGWSAARVAAAS